MSEQLQHINRESIELMKSIGNDPTEVKFILPNKDDIRKEVIKRTKPTVDKIREDLVKQAVKNFGEATAVYPKDSPIVDQTVVTAIEAWAKMYKYRVSFKEFPANNAIKISISLIKDNGVGTNWAIFGFAFAGVVAAISFIANFLY